MLNEMNIYYFLQSLSHAFALRLTKFYPEATKPKFLWKKLRHHIPVKTLIYYSLFQFYILYGSTIWCYTS